MSQHTAQLTVAIRIRPLNETEKLKRAFQCVIPLDSQKVLVVDPEKFENNILRQNRVHERQFEFDAAFGPLATQEEVHSATTAPMIDWVLRGFNATVFAYGPTGTGKTYTMVGRKDKPGLMSLLTEHLYRRLNSDCTVQLSYMEIYNELIRDLLSPNSPVLELLEDVKGNVHVPGLSFMPAPTSGKLMEILEQGNARRTQEATALNKCSSRSHALLQLSIFRGESQLGKLFLIDLAGSERASQTENRGQRFKEGAAINRSLLALGNVINALSSGSKDRYVNYRDSKLTRLLKDSLGGNSKTCMIAHVTPSSTNYDEIYNTLIYATRARSITTKLTSTRPASADRQHSQVIDEFKKELNLRSMHHAMSSKNLSFSDQNSSIASPRRRNDNVTHRSYQQAPRKFTSLFYTLKEQYVEQTEKLQRLRERLLRANCETVSAEIDRRGKLALINEWEQQKALVGNGNGGTPDSITRIRNDVNDQERHLTELGEQRQQLEKAFKKGEEMAKNLEKRMYGLTKDEPHRELIDLIVRMGRLEAEKMAAKSDALLQELKVKKQEKLFGKVHKYERVIDRLISGQLEEEERRRLNEEYRNLKSQIQFCLIPSGDETSWNALLLRKSKRLSISTSTSQPNIGPTRNATISGPKRTSNHRDRLPSISNEPLTASIPLVLNSAITTTPSSTSVTHLPQI